MGSSSITALEALAVAGTILGITVLIVAVRGWQKRRDEALHRAASMLGFTFVGRPRVLPIPDLKKFKLLRKGGTVDELMRGQIQGRVMLLFRYTLVVHYGHGASVSYWRVAAFQSSSPLPQFQLQPQSWSKRLKHALAHRDMAFESHPEVRQRFYITSDNPNAARNLFDSQVLSQLTAIPAGRFVVEASGHWLLVYARGRANLKPEMIPGVLQQAEDLSRIFFDRQARPGAGALNAASGIYNRVR